MGKIVGNVADERLLPAQYRADARRPVLRMGRHDGLDGAGGGHVSADYPPASSLVQVSALVHPEARVEVEALAAAPLA
jgi:hypothetical protein